MAQQGLVMPAFQLVMGAEDGLLTMDGLAYLEAKKRRLLQLVALKIPNATCEPKTWGFSCPGVRECN